MRHKNKKLKLLTFLILLLDAKGGLHAQSYLSPGYIFGEIRQSMGFYSMPEAPDFVVKARPSQDSLQYAPLKPPPRNFHEAASRPASMLEEKASSIAELEEARAKVKSQANKVRAGSANTIDAAKSMEVKDPPPMTWNPWDTE